MDQMLVILEQLLPVIIAAFVPLVVAGLRKLVPKIPSTMIPVLLPIAGGALATIGKLVGYEVGDDVFSSAETFSAAVQGLLVGSAAVGIHQIKKQSQKE